MSKILRSMVPALAVVAAQAFPQPQPARALSALESGVTGEPVAVTDVAYEIRFDAGLAAARRVQVAMSFTVASPGDVALSLPAWTPGAYEISNYARNVTDFAAHAGGVAIKWDKMDHDTWRVRAPAAGSVEVSFEFVADTLDNAMAWSRPDFLLLNGTNVFPYPEGAGFDFSAAVSVSTEPGWHVATGMSRGSKSGTWSESNYHDLIDMPWFIGRFDLDSMSIDGRMNRLATYPAGIMDGQERQQFWGQIESMMPPMSAVFGETPWQTYTTMLIFDDAYPGGSALEHQNSHVGIYNTGMVGNLVLPLITAHEVFHAWNVKRMRPVEMTPYAYDRPQPTPWLWVSEGVTDYYADLSLVRSGIAPAEAFYAITNGKIANVGALPDVALEDASVSTWIQPVDGTGYVYYDKGSLAGLLLDIQIRDGSDNAKSLDTVMRDVYASTYGRGRGFTGEDWWSAVSSAAGGRSFDEFRDRYIDGREAFPWERTLPLAGMKFVVETTREPRIGVQLSEQPDGVRVEAVTPGSMAAAAGIQAGDRLVRIGGIEVRDLAFGDQYRQRYASQQQDTPIPITVERDGATVELTGALRFEERVDGHIEPDPAATGKAVRIRDGILTGRVGQ